jgi:signal transduction histidine kinase
MLSNTSEQMDIDAIFETYKDTVDKSPKIDVIIEHYLSLVNQLKKDLNLLRDDFAYHKEISKKLPEVGEEFINIRNFSSYVFENLRLDQLLDRLDEITQRIIPHKKSEIFLIEDENFVASKKRPYRDHQLILKCAKEEGILNWLWDQGHPIIVPLSDFVVYNKLRSKKGFILLTPMIVEAKGIGVYLIHTDKGPNKFSLKDLEYLNLLTQQAAHAINFSNIQMKLEERERQIKQYQNQLMKMLKMATIGEIGGGIAHEINNPLQIIMGNVQMARMGHKVEESLEIIEKQAFRIANIVRGLLSMARQTNDSASEFLEINSLIINTLNLIRGQIEKRNIEISFNLQEKLPVIRCGSVYFQQILLNFLLHSKKQIGENGFINIETAVDEQDFVVITIKDSGVAVPEEYISKVMDPFSELENSTELNLGLTVSVQMVTDIGGSVQIKSDQKSGNNVTIKLPGLVNKQLKIKKEVV